jgi:hypothetical protein
VIAGFTVKVANALSTTVPLEGQLTVIVYVPAAAAAGAAPTANEPTTIPILPAIEALYEATTLPDGELSDTLQVVPTGETPATVVPMIITSPCFPEVGASVMVKTAACASGSIAGMVIFGIVIWRNGRMGILGMTI